MESPSDNPIARLDIAGEEHEMRRDNSALFTHLGDLACYDHIFVQYEAGKEMGAYIFRANDSFYALMSFMAEHKFPMHLNAIEVAECDRDAYIRTVEQETGDVPDFIPDEWA